MKIEVYLNSENDFIPKKFTCEGENISPRIVWSDVPKEAKSLALIIVDPDAPSKDFVHWIVFNIPTNLTDLPENITPTLNLPAEVRMGSNDFGVAEYKGPCPPSGETHNYHFKLYALNVILEMDAGATKVEFRNAIEKYKIKETEAVFKYKK